MLNLLVWRVSLAAALAVPAIYVGWTGDVIPFHRKKALPVAESGLVRSPESNSVSNDLTSFVGTWEMYDQGLRRITVNPDGTATMEVKIDSIGRWLYGSRFTLDLQWSLDDQVLSYSIVGGRPARSLNRVVDNYGRDYQYRVVHQRGESIALEDLGKPGTVYEWTNVGG